MQKRILRHHQQRVCGAEAHRRAILECAKRGLRAHGSEDLRRRTREHRTKERHIHDGELACDQGSDRELLAHESPVRPQLIAHIDAIRARDVVVHDAKLYEFLRRRVENTGIETIGTGDNRGVIGHQSIGACAGEIRQCADPAGPEGDAQMCIRECLPGSTLHRHH